MHARVATFQEGNPESIHRMVGRIKELSADGPPEGVPSTGLLILHQADQGKVIAISLFETEDDLRQGDATLNAMDPPEPGGLGRRASVEMYEVGVKLDA